MKVWHKASIAVAVATVTVLLLLAVTSVLSPLLVVANPDPSWWDTDWDYRKKLAFNNGGQTENLVNFPVLIKLTPANFNYANCESDGRDIRFVDADDSTALDYHFEEWTYNGTSWIWVEVPQIDGGSSTDYIWLYYGNSVATDAQNETGTYNANYMAVWHLEEATGGAGAIMDSTANNNDGTDSGSPSFNTSGQIDSAIDFDGTDDYIAFGNQPSVAGQSQITFECWLNADVWDDPLTGTGNVLFQEKYANTSNTERFTIGEYNSQLALSTRSGNSSSPLDVLSIEQPSTGSWHYLVAIYDADNDVRQLWIDGLMATQNTASIDAFSVDAGADIQIAWDSSGTSSRVFDGIIDEVRISDVTRSADWIKAQYLSMTDNFIAYSDVALTGWGWGPDEERGIGDVDFPALISAVPRADAPEVSDIRFTGNLTLTYPDTTVRTFALNLTGVKARSTFYLRQHEFDGNGSAWGANFYGTWLTWNDSGVDQHYLSCTGNIHLPHGDVWKTVKPYFFLLRTADVVIPDPVEPDGEYADTIQYIIHWMVKLVDNTLTELSATEFWDVLGDALDRATVIIKEVRNRLVPYIP
jgi:hypothetical protein